MPEMTLTEAIAIWTARINCEDEGNPRKVYYAAKLLIEAGKREQKARPPGRVHPGLLLPGETEE